MALARGRWLATIAVMVDASGDGREQLLPLLARAAALGAVCRVVRAGLGIPPPPRAVITPTPRLLVVLAGARRMRICRGGRSEVATLDAGTVLVAPPGCWTDPVYPIGECEHLGLGIRPGYLRLNRNLARSRRPARGSELKLWHHTRRPLDPAGRHALRALLELAPTRAEGLEASLLAGAVLRLAHAAAVDDSAPPVAHGVQLYHLALELIEERCREPIGRDDIAAQLGVHPNHLSRLFAEHGAAGFTVCLLAARLAVARDLLRGTEMPVAAVASASGFGTTGHFIRAFRSEHGTTPGRWRCVSA